VPGRKKVTWVKPEIFMEVSEEHERPDLAHSMNRAGEHSQNEVP
jgi:hypothetical protein